VIGQREDTCLTKLKGLAGKRLLVLEDGFFLDEETKRLLEAADAVVQSTSWIDADLVLSSQAEFDGAIVDVNLEADMAFSLTEKLGALGVPFIFALSSQENGGKFGAYRLCADLDELNAIAEGLFGRPMLN
jgi:hypothetical protein